MYFDFHQGKVVRAWADGRVEEATTEEGDDGFIVGQEEGQEVWVYEGKEEAADKEKADWGWKKGADGQEGQQGQEGHEGQEEQEEQEEGQEVGQKEGQEEEEQEEEEGPQQLQQQLKQLQQQLMQLQQLQQQLVGEQPRTQVPKQNDEAVEEAVGTRKQGACTSREPSGPGQEPTNATFGATSKAHNPCRSQGPMARDACRRQVYGDTSTTKVDADKNNRQRHQ